MKVPDELEAFVYEVQQVHGPMLHGSGDRPMNCLPFVAVTIPVVVAWDGRRVRGESCPWQRCRHFCVLRHTVTRTSGWSGLGTGCAALAFPTATARRPRGAFSTGARMLRRRNGVDYSVWTGAYRGRSPWRHGAVSAGRGTL
jgi:hypothetical protein